MPLTISQADLDRRIRRAIEGKSTEDRQSEQDKARLVELGREAA